MPYPLDGSANLDTGTLIRVFVIAVTSLFQRQVGGILGRYFNHYIENYRPNWLKGLKERNLELDFFIPEHDIAVEVQGQQHYRFSSLFHSTPEAFEEQLLRDALKRDMCCERGILLIEISDIQFAEEIIRNLSRHPVIYRYIVKEVERIASTYAHHFVDKSLVEASGHRRGKTKLVRKLRKITDEAQRQDIMSRINKLEIDARRGERRAKTIFEIRKKKFMNEGGFDLVVNGVKENIVNLYRIAGVEIII